MKLYLDSNVLISALKDELDSNFRFLSYESAQFFKWASKSKIVLLVSDLFFQEIKDKLKLDKKSIAEYFSSINILLEYGEVCESDLVFAKKIEKCKIHYPDSVHIAIAKRTGCEFIVTFNIKDFKKANSFIISKEPLFFV